MFGFVEAHQISKTPAYIQEEHYPLNLMFFLYKLLVSRALTLTATVFTISRLFSDIWELCHHAQRQRFFIYFLFIYHNLVKQSFSCTGPKKWAAYQFLRVISSSIVRLSSRRRVTKFLQPFAIECVKSFRNPWRRKHQHGSNEHVLGKDCIFSKIFQECFSYSISICSAITR